MPSKTQAIALWRAYHEVCPYCSELVKFKDLEVDHIIPETSANRPELLKALLDRIGFPDLDLNSYRNWFPVHGKPCNRSKSKSVWQDTTLQNYLNLALRNEMRVLEEERKIRRQARNRDALIPLISLIEAGEISKKEVIAFVQNISASVGRSEPLILAFGINVFDARNSGDIPATAPQPPRLYDWLIDELENALRSTEALFAQATRIADDRNGETVSARYAFWLLDLDKLPQQLPNSWQLLELASFSELYPNEDPEDLFAKGIRAKYDELVYDTESSDPMPYLRCPQCMSTDLKRASQDTAKETVYYVTCNTCSWGERF